MEKIHKPNAHANERPFGSKFERLRFSVMVGPKQKNDVDEVMRVLKEKVVLKSRRAPKRKREEECALFLTEMPPGGVSGHGGLSALADLVDDDRNTSEAQIGLALL